jgi:regulator of replication initiation timing
MDINKSLYMADFLKVRQELGTVENYQLKNTLFMNLYDQMTPKSHSNEVIQLVKDIEDDTQEKTVMILEKTSSTMENNVLPELFSDLPDEEPIKEEVKTIQVTKEKEPEKQVKEELKQIVIDPNYIVKEK